MSNIQGCFSHNSDDWRTPSDIYDQYMKNGFIDCFPYHAQYDEFKMTYKDKKLFVNPPYSKLKYLPQWVER